MVNIRARAPSNAALSEFVWSSYPAYLKPGSQRPARLRVDRVLGQAGVPKDSPAGRREYGQRMEVRRWADDPDTYKQIRRGWALGSEEFREELPEAAQRRGSEYIAGDEIRESEEQKARRIVAQELRKLGWTRRELQVTRKGDVRKIRLARRLRTETTMTLKWISTELNMGTWTHLATGSTMSRCNLLGTDPNGT